MDPYIIYDEITNYRCEPRGLPQSIPADFKAHLPPILPGVVMGRNQGKTLWSSELADPLEDMRRYAERALSQTYRAPLSYEQLKALQHGPLIDTEYLERSLMERAVAALPEDAMWWSSAPWQPFEYRPCKTTLSLALEII